MGLRTGWHVRLQHTLLGHVTVWRTDFGSGPSCGACGLRRDPCGRDTVYRRIWRIASERCSDCGALPHVRGLHVSTTLFSLNNHSIDVFC